MTPILQKSLPFAPWGDPRTRRLPGVMPLDDIANWLQIDDAYAAQMALRDQLIAEKPDAVHGVTDQASAAMAELYAMVLPLLPALGFRIAGNVATRPDGVEVPLHADQPLLTLGRLVQEDFCIMQDGDAGEHVLSAAILCFPAGWMLAEKLGRAMMRIHAPVPRYDQEIGHRVQRMMSLVRPDAPLWRANAHHSRAGLHNPLSEAAPRDVDAGSLPYVRSERQTFVRLPHSRAVVFSIHTYLVRLQDLSSAQAAALADHPIHAAV